MSIKYVFLGNSQSGKPIGEYPSKPKEQWSQDSKTIFDRYCKSNTAKIDQRNKVAGTDGNICFIIMPSNIFYLIIAEFDQQEREVFQLIDEIHRDSIYLLTDEKGDLNKIGKTSLKTLIESHMRKSPQTKKISDEVDDIKIEMKAAIAKTVSNVENVQSLEHKAVKIKESSHTFKKNANELRKITCWQNCKWTIILVILIIGVLLVIIIPIAVSSSKGDTSNSGSNGQVVTNTNGSVNQPSNTASTGTVGNSDTIHTPDTTGNH
jgi:hypothetical protein